MSSPERTTAADADLGRIRHETRTSQNAGFLKMYGDGKASMKRMMLWQEWDLMPVSLTSWWSSQRERDEECHALPTASTGSFENFGGSSKGGMVSPTVPIAAEDRTYKSGRTEPRISPVLLVLVFFIMSTCTVLSALWTLSLHTVVSSDQAYALPKTVAEVSSLVWALKGYSETSSTGLLHVLAVLSLMSVWANAWSIPGSVVLNILTGALLPPFFATLLQAILTTIGSLIATIIAAPLTPIITRFFPSIKTLTRIALDGSTPSSSSHSKSSPWARLAILRLLGIVPWSSINFFSGLARPRISFLQCAIGAFIGVLPWTAVTCQVGDILSSLTVSSSSSTSSYLDAEDALTSATAMATQTISSILTSREAVLKLLLLTLISLAPVLAKDKLQAWLNGADREMAELPIARGKHQEEGPEVVELEASEGRKVHQGRLSVEWWRRNVGFGRGVEELDEETLVALSMVKERI